MTGRTVLLMAGGTGGHIYPALAVAECLSQKGLSIVWLGTRQGLESDIVPAAGYPVEWINISGLRGKGLVSLLFAPVKLMLACCQAAIVILKIKPVLVLGMGGFVAGPGGLMAWLLNKPLLIHEQNAIAGLTNQYLAKLAHRVMHAFPNAFPDNAKNIQLGNPVRQAIVQLYKMPLQLPDDSRPLNILVLGGSLGATVLNETVPAAIAKIDADNRPLIKHQSGQQHYEQAKQYYQQYHINAEVFAYIEEMDKAYLWADLIICRAGAMTIAEIAAAGLPAILVPLPHVADDHQTANARYLVDVGAAILMPQQQLNADTLYKMLNDLNPDKLYQMAQAARQRAIPNAAMLVTQQCLQFIDMETTA